MEPAGPPRNGPPPGASPVPGPPAVEQFPISGTTAGPGPLPPEAPAGPPPPLVPVLLAYTALRIVLIVVLAVLLSLVMIPLVALVFAVVLQLPLAWLLFAPLRRKVNLALAGRQSTRRVERDRLRAALRGEAAGVEIPPAGNVPAEDAAPEVPSSGTAGTPDPAEQT